MTQPGLQEPRTAADSPPGASRKSILDTAEVLFARRGYEGVGLREISRLAKLSKSALFHHFPTKMDLYVAVLARVLGELDTRLSELPDPGQGAVARLVSLVGATLDALGECPARAPLLLRTLFEGEVIEQGTKIPEVDGPLERILGAISSRLSEGVESGDIRPISVPHATQSLIGMLLFHFASGEFGDEILGRPVFSASEIRRHKEFVLSFIATGLAVRPTNQQGAPES